MCGEVASLRRFSDSRYWFAIFIGPDGRQKQRSTKETDRKRAQKIADRFAEAARLGRMGLLAEKQARRVISDIFEISSRQKLPQDTTGTYFTRWIASKQLTLRPKAYERYRGIVEVFLKWLGVSRAALGLTHLSRIELAGFRDYLAARHAPGSVNVSLAVLQAALQDAFQDGLVDVNEAARVPKLDERRSKTEQRRAFTPEEIRSILAAADPEWQGMVLTSLYAGGMRLGDVADLQWEFIDFGTREIRFPTEKTRRQLILPIAEPLYRHWYEIAGVNPKGPLFPRAFELRQRNVPTSALSNQFYRVLTAAGLVEKRKNRSKGKGRSAARTTGGLGFHCLRHTATTMLKAGGVSDAVAREIVGHESPAISRMYSHLDGSVLREALNRLPDLTSQ
jgi:integrase